MMHAYMREEGTEWKFVIANGRQGGVEMEKKTRLGRKERRSTKGRNKVRAVAPCNTSPTH